MAKRNKRKSDKKPPNVWTGLFIFFSVFSLLALPLIHSQQTMDITMMPRMLAWTVFLFLLSLVFLSSNMLKQVDFSVFRRRMFAMLAAFFLISLFSLLFASNVKAGIYDLVKAFSFILFIAYAVVIFPHADQWPERLTRFFIAGTLLSLVIGYIQYVSDLGIGIHDRGSMTRLKGLMSNVNMYASYLMMMVPFVVFGLVRFRGTWRRLSALALLMCLLMILLLQTRAVYLGTMAGVLAAGFLFLFFYKQFQISRQLRNRVGVFFLAGMMVAGATFVLLPHDHVIKSRMVSIVTDTDNPRVLIWKTTTSMIADNLITGVGAGNFHIRMPEYAGEHGLGDHGITWMRPHNDYLWVASEKGVFGLLVYLSIFALAFFEARLIIRSDAGQKEKVLAGLILAGLAAYMVHAFFDFPYERVNQQVVLGIYLSALLAMSHAIKGREVPLTRPAMTKAVVAIAVVLSFAGVLYSFHAIKLEKNISLARQAHALNNHSGMLRAANDAKTPFRNIDPIGNPVYMYECLAYMGLNNIALAAAACEKAREVSPNRRTVLLPLGYIYLSAGQYDQAIDCMAQILRMFPADPMALTVMGGAYHSKGLLEKALQCLERIPEEQRSDQASQLISTILNEMSQTDPDPDIH